MSQTERIYRIDQTIHQRRVVAFNELLSILGVSRATLKRDIAFMRDRLNAPIQFDRERGGYCFVEGQLGPQYELPGLWFSDREVLALLTMQRMLEELDTGGLVGPHIAPLMERVRGLLGSEGAPAEEIVRRVRIVQAHVRTVAPVAFEVIGSALVKRHRVEVCYYTRTRDVRSVRELSPQRLVHYRNAWYLDAWCHKTESLRVFSMDAIEQARSLNRRAHDVSMAEIDRELGSGYGIFRGRQLRWAVLRFSPQAARWVRSETWHPLQKGRDTEDGGYELRVPYGNPTELEMDILRHAEHVSVVSPASLRQRIAERLGLAARLYAIDQGPSAEAPGHRAP